MKTLLKIILIFFISSYTLAQNGINYKAVIRDAGGAIIANSLVAIQFTISESSAAGTIVYSENHSPTTDANGIIVINIGEGTTADVFTDIAWGNNEHWLNVQVNTGAGLVDMGTTKLMAVPYALNAANVTGLEALDEGNGIGWRLVGQDPINYGDIGENAIDLSYSNTGLFINGALGQNSFATGFYTRASGDYSTAMGHNNEASGDYSIAIGANSEATANYSTSLGRFSIASGEGATAIGYSTLASGDFSTSMGNSTEASGNFSTAMGFSSEASETYATAIGYETTASGGASTAMGFETIASGGVSIAMGTNTEATGTSSTAMGTNTESSGESTTAMGRGTTATSFYSTAMGHNTQALGHTSTAMGSDTEASGDYSTAMGRFSLADGESSTAIGENVSALGENAMAFGLNSNASGTRSVALGRRLISRGSGQIVLGSFNEAVGTFPNHPAGTPYGNEPVFIVGNGGSEQNRGNALVVLFNSYVGIGTNTPQERLHILGRLRIGTETIEDSGSNQLSFGASLIPDANNSYRLGNSSSRWIGVWAVDGTINTSDRRDKENITELNYGLKEIQKLKPVSFNWKDRPEAGTKLGLIAQDLNEIIPEVVMSDEIVYSEDDPTSFEKKPLDRLGVYYSDLIPVLINAIKEQQELISEQNNKIQTITSEMTTIKVQMNTLQTQLKK